MEESEVRDQELSPKQKDFVRIDSCTELLKKIIDHTNARKSIYPINSTFDPVHLTECPRRIMYRSSGVECCNPISYLNNLSPYKTRWISFLRCCRGLRVLDENKIVADSEFNITGSADVVLSMDGEIYVAQIKPVSDEEFKKVETKGAFKKDVVETIVYIWLMEIQDGFIIYDNKNDGGFLLFHITPYQPIIKSVMAKCEKLVQDKVYGKLPLRPYESCVSKECKICEFLSTCWKRK